MRSEPSEVGNQGGRVRPKTGCVAGRPGIQCCAGSPWRAWSPGRCWRRRPRRRWSPSVLPAPTVEPNSQYDITTAVADQPDLAEHVGGERREREQPDDRRRPEQSPEAGGGLDPQRPEARARTDDDRRGGGLERRRQDLVAGVQRPPVRRHAPLLRLRPDQRPDDDQPGQGVRAGRQRERRVRPER